MVARVFHKVLEVIVYLFVGILRAGSVQEDGFIKFIAPSIIRTVSLLRTYMNRDRFRNVGFLERNVLVRIQLEIETLLIAKPPISSRIRGHN